jgi:hypothetical protein
MNAMIFLEELGSGRGSLEANLVLGVKCDNRESVHGPKESRFDAEHWVGFNPNPLRRVRKMLLTAVVGLNDQRQSTNDVLPRTNFDN